jgi:hypothetical protein
MNNKFNFNRFGKVLRMDFHNSTTLFRTSFIICCCLPLAVWLFCVVLGNRNIDTIDPIVRRFMIYGTAILAGILAPARIYRTINQPNRGIYYAMLPASKSEKFWSQVVMCYLIVPVMTVLAGIVLDTVLRVIPFGPYHEWLWQNWPLMNEIVNTMSAEDYARLYGWEPTQTYLIIRFLNNTPTVFFLICLFFTGVASDIAIFFFTNTIFKKHKVSQTILWLIAIQFVLQLVGVPILTNINWNNIDIDYLNHLTPSRAVTLIQWIAWGGIVANILFTVLISWWTAARIKKMSY